MRISIILCLSLFCFQAGATGIEFFKGTWEEALELAEREDKLIFVDAYASWCGPCKRMSREVFPEEKVGEFYNENFISLKLDMEKDAEGIKFRKKYPVSAFPTLYYVDYDGKVVLKVKGAQTASKFVEVGQKALGMVDRSADYAKAYENGDRDAELVYNYIKALNKAGKSSQKIANDYLKDQANLNTPENLKILLEATVLSDSRIFDLLIKNRAAVEGATSKEIVQAQILKACENTVDRAIEFKSPELLEEAKSKLKANYPERAEAFGLEAEMDYYYAAGNVKKYVGVCKKYMKAGVDGDSEEMHGLAIDIVKKFINDEKAMSLAEDCAETAALGATNYEYYLTYAMILKQNGKKSEALEVAQTSMELAKQIGPNAVQRVEMTIQQLEG